MSQNLFKWRISDFFLLTLFLCPIYQTVLSDPYYDNNSNIRLAHKYMYALRLVSAEKLLHSEELKNPLNGYVTFYRLYNEVIALTISNSPEEFRRKVPELDNYIRKLKELPDGTPEYRMLLGEAYVFTGLLDIKYENKFPGLINCLKGYNLLESNAQKYPLFQPDDKVLGIIQIGVAFLPKALQWGARLLSIESNPRAGLKNLDSFSEFARGKPGYQEEAFLFTMTGYRLMNEEDAAMKLIKGKMADFKEIAALSLFASTVCTQANDAETALALLSGIAPEKLEITFPQVLYMKGITKLMRLDTDSDIPFLTYLNVASGTDYIKSVLYDLASFYFISGDTARYLDYISQVKKKGREFLTRDVEAYFEAEKPGFPNVYLMQADLLVRGGYIRKAEDELSRISRINELNAHEKSLFYFLRGECFRLRNLTGQAESEYLNSVLAAGSSGSYIAQRAFVTSGMMLERNNLKREAEKYYNSCLHFKARSNPYSDQYKNKARAGLTRLSLSE